MRTTQTDSCIKFARTIEDFLVKRTAERGLSPRTRQAYEETLNLFLGYASRATQLPVTALNFDCLTEDLVVRFLDHLELERGNCARTRNARLAAIRALYRYAMRRVPSSIGVLTSVVAIGFKRFTKPPRAYLPLPEMEALIRAADDGSWAGSRDTVMFRVAFNAGARVSEMTGAAVGDVHGGRSPEILLHGKGRKERPVPLWPSTWKALRSWMAARGDDPKGPLFPSRDGDAMTRSAVARRVHAACARAAKTLPALRHKKVTTHTFRHSCAMYLLEQGKSPEEVALFLGQERLDSVRDYLTLTAAHRRRILEAHDPGIGGRNVSPGSAAPPLRSLLASLTSRLNLGEKVDGVPPRPGRRAKPPRPIASS